MHHWFSNFAIRCLGDSGASSSDSSSLSSLFLASGFSVLLTVPELSALTACKKSDHNLNLVASNHTRWSATCNDRMVESTYRIDGLFFNFVDVSS